MKTLGTLTFTLSLLILTGCGDANTDTDYPAGVAPIDEDTQATENHPGPGEVSPESESADEPYITLAAEGLYYTVPEGWTVGGPRQMRVLTLDAGDGVEVAIAKWPTGVGGMETNLTRWFGQAGYNPADAAQIAQARAGFEVFPLGDAQATWAAMLDGNGGTPMIGIWAPRGENPTAQSETWTIKITGDADALRAKQNELRVWVRTLSFE